MTMTEHKFEKLTESKPSQKTGNGHCFQRKSRRSSTQGIRLLGVDLMSLHINLCMPWGQTLSFPSPMGSKKEEYGRFPFEVGKKKKKTPPFYSKLPHKCIQGNKFPPFCTFNFILKYSGTQRDSGLVIGKGSLSKDSDLKCNFLDMRCFLQQSSA